MTALLVAFLRNQWPALALAASILAISTFIYMKGWSDRGEKDKIASQAHTINRTDNRGKINEKVRSMDDAGICGVIDGVYINNQCK